MFSSAQRVSPSTVAVRVRPSAVIEYSTVTGTAAALARSRMESHDCWIVTVPSGGPGESAKRLMREAALWRREIDSLSFMPAGHQGECVVHRRAFRVLLGG